MDRFKIIAALCVVPFQMPVPTVSEAISKNIVEGASLPWEVATSYKQEICKIHTERLSTETSRWMDSLFDSGTPLARKIVDDGHNTINDLSDAELKMLSEGD